MEDFNLHLTGDVHAVAAAHNLAAAFIDNHIHHGNALGHRPAGRSSGRACWTSTTARCARSSSASAGARTATRARPSCDITVASEVMAILALASDLGDLRARLGPDRRRDDARRPADHGRGAQGRRRDDGPAARRDQAEPAPDARGRAGLRPLRAVRQHRPRQQLGPRRPDRARPTTSRVHRGRLRRGHGLREVHRHQVPRVRPAARRGRHRGHDPRAEDARRRGQDRGRQAARPGAARGELGRGPAGGANLAKHIENVRASACRSVVAINAFPTDTPSEVEAVREVGARRRRPRRGRRDALRRRAARAPRTWPRRSGPRPRRARRTSSSSTRTTRRWPTKIEAIATQVYGADGVDISPRGRASSSRSSSDSGFGTLPICMAKTPVLAQPRCRAQGPPTGFRVPIREVRLSAGAGFVTPLLRRHADDARASLAARRREHRHRRRRRTSSACSSGLVR